MGGFLTELGKKLAERWLTLLALPGALYLAILATAHTLGHTHPFTLSRVTDRLSNWTTAPATMTVLLLFVVLLAAAAAGLTAQALGSLIERAWLADRWTSRRPPLLHVARLRIRRRHRRWTTKQSAYRALAQAKAEHLAHGDPVPPELDQALIAGHSRITRIALEEPARPGWIGDRLHAVVHRMDRDYRLDLPTVWPYLWLTMPEETRMTITDAKTAFGRSATLAGWGVLYLAAGILWWPGALLAAAILITARHRAHDAIETYASLVEAATRLHTPTLATTLRLDHTGPLAPATGWAVTCLLQGRPDLIPFVPDK